MNTLITELGKLLPLIIALVGAVAYLHTRFAKVKEDSAKVVTDMKREMEQDITDLYNLDRDRQKQIGELQSGLANLRGRLNILE